MKVAETYDILISVETEYISLQSHPEKGEYFFAYRIKIQNNSLDTVQLLRRNWFIVDSVHEIREVKGDGVVGLQPILDPGDSHTYRSGCILQSEIGEMWGYYTFERQSTESLIKVDIPRFELMVPWLSN
ncbi:MAG: Co2+/Mg2+ efflux protein ApaG [bacterium]|nr:Co2+/Mg2+ efflux protein ApaG [bacterium]